MGLLVFNTPYSICYLAVIIVPFISFYFASSVHEHFYGHYGGDDRTTLEKAIIIGGILGTFLSFPIATIIIVFYGLSKIYN